MEKVGFVGLGLMGAAMARNLLRVGHELVVYNRTRAKAEGLSEHGADVADPPREVAERSSVVITMLPGPPEGEEVIAGDNGLLEGAREGSLIVDMSTSSPLLARELSGTAKARGVRMLDAPVSGRDVGAREGTLSIMVGGEEENFGRAKPLFDAMGETVVHVGGAGLLRSQPLPRRLTVPTTSRGDASLSSTSSAPWRMALSMLVGWRLALMIRTTPPGLASRSSPIRSAPLPSGRPRSRTTTSNLAVAAWPRASAMEPAWATTSRSGWLSSRATIRFLKSG